MREKVQKWTERVETLAKMAAVQPHAVYAAYRGALSHTWTFTQRTMKDVSTLFAPLRDAIQRQLVPALFDNKGVEFGGDFLNLIGLPHRHGGMMLCDPVAECDDKHSDSLAITALLTELVISSERSLPEDYEDKVYVTKMIVRTARRKREEEKAAEVKARLSCSQQRAVELACEKGGSSVFTVVPLDCHGFALKAKRDFFDLVRMRYRLPLFRLPTTCACGKPYSLDHSQICKKGGFIHMRHDEPKELFAGMASVLWRDVGVEPLLEELSGEVMSYRSAKIEDDCRSDVRVRGFWAKQQNAFFEFRIFYPFASSYLSTSLPALYRRFAKERKREYEERINVVDAGSFTPMIASSTGGMGPEMQMALKHLALLLAEKNGEKYADVMSLLRCRFSFAIARSALVCLRGSRSRFQGVGDNSMELPARVVRNETAL